MSAVDLQDGKAVVRHPAERREVRRIKAQHIRFEDTLMEAQRILNAAQFILKLMKERVDESKRLLKAGERAEADILLTEADLLKDAFDAIDIHNLEGR